MSPQIPIQVKLYKFCLRITIKKPGKIGVIQINPQSLAKLTIPDEFAIYLRAPPEKNQENPVLFWKQMASTYACVSEIAF